MVELEYIIVLETMARKGLGVQIPLLAPEGKDMSNLSKVQQRSRELSDWMHPDNLSMLQEACKDAVDAGVTHFDINPRYLHAICTHILSLQIMRQEFAEVAERHTRRT